MLFTLPLASLEPRVAYCVLRDPVMHESIVVLGREIQAEYESSRDFKRYYADEPISIDYVKVECGKFVLAIWRDPTRPELNVPREVAPSELIEPVALANEAPPPEPIVVQTTMEESLAAEREHAQEIAEDYERCALDELLRKAAVSVVETLYVQ